MVIEDRYRVGRDPVGQMAGFTSKDGAMAFAFGLSFGDPGKVFWVFDCMAHIGSVEKWLFLAGYNYEKERRSKDVED